MFRLPTLALLMGTLVVSQGAMAQTHKTTTAHSATQSSAMTQDAQQTAKAWGLSKEDYDRYESIMQGPRGKWSPDIDPITALGLNARSDAERAKYARMAVKAERARVTQELAFQRAYDEAWKEMYPDAQRVNPFTTKGKHTGTSQAGNPFGQSASGATTSSVFNTARRPSRMNVVVATAGCADCDSTVKQLLSQQVGMDIWVTDADGDDGKIRQWAARVGIPPKRVSSGDITLNHAGKTLNIAPSELPRVAPRN